MAEPADALLEKCSFPPKGSSVSLAVSGGPDSLAMLLLALEAGLEVAVHHVDHHARANSTKDAEHVREICRQLEVPFTLHDVDVAPGGNFEDRARMARRRLMPRDVLTGHTMDDVVETMLLNMMRGSARTGLSPMIASETKPLIRVQRAELHQWLYNQPFKPVLDETNNDLTFRRNQVRQELMPMLRSIARRDIVPVMFRQAELMYEEERWLRSLTREDEQLTLAQADCRELRRWPTARLRRWLRHALRDRTDEMNNHPPTADEVERAMEVVRGTVTACELSGGRRLSRSEQRLTLS